MRVSNTELDSRVELKELKLTFHKFLTKTLVTLEQFVRFENISMPADSSFQAIDFTDKFQICG